MSNSYMNTLSPEKLAEAKQKAEHDIRNRLRSAATMRAVADALDGVYVTKRIEPKLLAAIPGAERVYLGKPTTYGGDIDLYVYYQGMPSWHDSDSIRICDTKTRRIDGKKLTERAVSVEAEARRREENLARLDTAAEIYNDLADRYASIYAVLEDFLYSAVPYADYDLQKKYKNSPAPLTVLPPVPAPSSAPRPVRSASAKKLPRPLSLDEFADLYAAAD